MIHDETKAFIVRCAAQGNIYWTYHSNMRLAGRFIPREKILLNLSNLEVIQSYEDDSPLPSCLCIMYVADRDPVHLVIALDSESESIRVITVYRPDPLQWEADLKRRKNV